MTVEVTPLVATVAELRPIVRGWHEAGEKVALVPTMGALHEGHMALVRLARSRAVRVVTSIFVNPAQFAPHEDFDRYPRDLDADLTKLASAGCDLVWAPSVAEMYPEGFATRIVSGGAAEGLESDYRPHFFAGVATVCCKLFTQVAPDFAVFGEKDYQQLCVVRQMVRDLDLALEIVGAPIVREPDGLALSSRNRYLTPEERKVAPALYRAVTRLADAVASDPPGPTPDIGSHCARARDEIRAAGFAKIDYVEVREAASLKPSQPNSPLPLRVLAAAWLGKTRLIDNVPVSPSPREAGRGPG